MGRGWSGHFALTGGHLSGLDCEQWAGSIYRALFISVVDLEQNQTSQPAQNHCVIRPQTQTE